MLKLLLDNVLYFLLVVEALRRCPVICHHRLGCSLHHELFLVPSVNSHIYILVYIIGSEKRDERGRDRARQ